MQTVENQKIIITPSDGVAEMWNKENHKGQEFNRELAFMMVQKKAMFQAMHDLKPVAFNVWLYLASQKPDFTFVGGFSPKAVSNQTGMKKTSIQQGIRVLVEKNYLVQKKKRSNIYYFYQIPQKQKQQNHTHSNNNDFQF